MLSHGHPYLLADNVSYTLDSAQTLFDGLQLSLSAGDRVALVGPNGVGKSTLLKILAGQLNPTQGLVLGQHPHYYLPQISTLRALASSKSVLEVLYTYSDQWWDVEHCLQATFGTILDLSQPIEQLSGGELTQLFLAIGLSRSPDVLLLDEPTNHLDHRALEALRRWLCEFEGAFVVVSHKPFFLDQVVKTVWELSPEGFQMYGGNYSHYREQKQREHHANLRAHEVARKALKRAKAAALHEQERAARSQRNGRQRQLSGDMPPVLAGALKRSAEVTAGALKATHDRAIAAATQNVADTKIKTHKATTIQLEERSQKHRTLIDIRGATLWVGDQCLIQPFNLHVTGGDRLSVAGVNGSGKSSLARAIVGHDSAVLKGGEVQQTTLQGMYLDQTYRLVDRHQTVLQNMQRANPSLTYQLLRQQLGHFLFFNDEVDKPAWVLSGGELARLAIAMITIAELDLLILDEPTNNLDIATLDQMVNALNAYQGALWVISHDIDFLSRIRIDRALILAQKTLQPMIHLPRDSENYYTELMLTCNNSKTA